MPFDMESSNALRSPARLFRPDAVKKIDRIVERRVDLLTGRKPVLSDPHQTCGVLQRQEIHP
jgi:hypothetical protein